ncbi:hypothetical protein C8R46DRAFT_938879 [Mycena filopes]|nr:hypothetical protein C8R46DRAFT_938879 [Mycena filopes]
MDESTAPQPTREKSLWFPDATLVLQAGDRLYRVFPGILAAKSAVFQDMLAFPQPANGETLDGCPLVRLSDRADDMTYFLKAIFHYDFFEAWPVLEEFSTFAAILRLSQKYQVDPLRARALMHLSERCAPTLEKWEEFTEWGVHPIELINFAREVSADWVLPQAFAACCWLDPTVLVSGLLPGIDGRTHAITLEPADLVRCIRGAIALHSTWTSKVLSFLWEPRQITGCMSPNRCLSARVSRQQDADAWRSEQVPVLELWNWYDSNRLQSSVCPICFEFMEEAPATAKEEYWQALPKIFDLPEWNILLEQRRAALDDFE